MSKKTKFIKLMKKMKQKISLKKIKVKIWRLLFVIKESSEVRKEKGILKRSTRESHKY